MCPAGLPRPEQDAQGPILVREGRGGTRRDTKLHHSRRIMDGLSRMGQSGESKRGGLRLTSGRERVFVFYGTSQMTRSDDWSSDRVVKVLFKKHF